MLRPHRVHPWSKPARRRWIAITIVIATAAVKTASVVLGQTSTSSAQLIEQGRLIYEAGQLDSGALLSADRGDQGLAATGRTAACINCHQRSGFGLFEAANLVPPVTGPSLFNNAQPRAPPPRRAKGIQHREFSFLTRPPYDEGSLARALREGISPSGHRFQYLMPRYALNDNDMAALIAYLRQLSLQPSPGIDQATAHFATVVAPGEDVSRRQAFIEVLRACFRERHPPDVRRSRLATPCLGAHRFARYVAGLNSRAKYIEQPVFALISGLGTNEWDPVHRFSQSKKIPSFFPNLDVAPAAEQDVYSFYFSRGVVLEAEVLGQYFIETASTSGLTRVVQLEMDGSAGGKAAAALRNVLEQQSIAVEDRVLKAGNPRRDRCKAFRSNP